MKIFKSFFGDHYAKLKIVGEFKEFVDLKIFLEKFNDFIEIIHKNKNIKINDFYKHPISEKNYFFSGIITENDLEAGKYFAKGDIKIKANKVIIKTNEFNIEFIIKLIVHYGGKVYIFSYHDYPEEK